MGLRDTAQNLVLSGFNILGNVAETAQVVSVDKPTYDAVTGVVTEVGRSQSVKVLFLDYEEKEIDGDRVINTDVKCLFPTKAFLGNVTVGDSVIRGISAGSVTFDVVDAQEDPTRSLWTLQLREFVNV